MEYKFSIVMAVYGVELYLREAIDSLIGQTIGFDCVQLILVDDGSRDSSGRICDEYAARYPDNILAIHKENGGVSSARNLGLAHSSGRYVNFMDADDKLTPDTLSRVWQFYESGGSSTDIVSIPIVYFEGKTGEHPLNFKFKKGARIIDLEKEWDAVQLSSSSAFFRREALEGLSFDTRVKYAEDVKLIQYVLISRMTLGVVPDACYLYRYRNQGSSALQRSQRDPNWYVPKLEYVSLETLRLYRERLGRVPRFIQYTFMYDLQWVLQLDAIPAGLLTDGEEQLFRDDIAAILQSIDDEVILCQKSIKIETKLHALSHIYGKSPELRMRQGDLDLCFRGQAVFSVSQRRPILEFFSFEGNECVVEGSVSLFSFPEIEWGTFAEFDGVPLPCETQPQGRSVTSLGTVLLDFYRFRLRVPLSSNKRSGRLRIGILANGQPIRPAQLNFGAYSGLSEWYPSSFFIRNGWCVRAGDGVVFSRARWGEGVVREMRFLRQLFTSRTHPARRAVPIRLACHLLRRLKRRPLWLISDRESRAGDNGEAFFRYMVNKHPEIDARFVLLPESPDYPALSRIGKIVPADSPRRKLLSLVSDYVISAQAETLNVRPFAPRDAAYRDFMARTRFIFLQHGVIKDDLSQWLRKSSKNIAGFVTSARPEYDSIVNGRYGYTEKEVWLTGLPRFDQLLSDPEPRQITIMPTWRKYLMGEMDPRTAIWPAGDRFYDSGFVRYYNELLSDERLIAAAKQYGYTLAFFPHPNLQSHLSAFRRNNAVVFLGPETAYRDVYAKSALVVTDYSSAIFDFVYMRRPVIYTQFDREEFFGGGHVYTEGYFDYERDGFGEVEHDLAGTVDRILEYMAGGCRMKEEYRARADRFFAFSDHNNCQRVYDKLIERNKS